MCTQDSVLGPLLFLIYVNEIGSALSDARVKLFTDDTNLCICSANTELFNQKAQSCIAQLHPWFIVNKLTLNLSIKCYMMFPKAQNQNEVNIIIDNVKPKNVNKCKHVGVILDNDLKSTAHLEMV
jgi:hypothetical protein